MTIRPVGAGGMGKVWVVRHRKTQEHGALKVLRGDADPEEEERFAREVEVLRSLRHGAIVRLLADGNNGDEPYLVMTYAPGETLEARLVRGDKIPLTDALPMFTALADGLRHAHDYGIHHRDVKAENVVLGADGWATLVDFGVALKHGASRLTSAGFVMGTFAYLAPEVVTGGERDPALADIYAFGQLLHEVLTGQPMFRGDPAETRSSRRWSWLVAEKSMAAALDPGPDFDERLREVVRHATAPEPEDRTKTMGELASGLRSLLDAEQEARLVARIGGVVDAAPIVAAAPTAAALPTPWLLVGVLTGVGVAGVGMIGLGLAAFLTWWFVF